jgi:invasion protein IalB
MNFRNAFAPAFPAARTLAVIAATATFALATAAVHAQTPPPASPGAPSKKAAPKQPAKQPAPAPTQAAPLPGVPGAPGAPGAPPAAAGQPQQIPLVYSAWIKLCGKNPQDPNAKELCQTMKEAHMESGQFVAAAALIEMGGEQKKILQLILPTRLLLPPGTRVTVDSNPPSDGPFIICAPEFCMSQHEVTDDFVAKLKAGQTLQIQAINDQKQTVSYLLPLADFAKAHDGPPTDPKILEEQRKEAQKKMQDELLKRGEEAQKKMQAPATK